MCSSDLGRVATVLFKPGSQSASLRVFDLAVEVLQPDGTFDVDAAARRQPDLALAEAEADAYARATQSAAHSLRRLPAK